MPADVPLACVCASLRRAARAVTQRYEEAFRGTGLRSTQFTLMQVLDKKGEMRQNHLDDILALDSTTLSRTLKPLEEQGWIRSRPGDDRRERYWSVTDRGRAKLDKVRPAWSKAQAELKEQLGDQRWASLLTDLADVAVKARSGGPHS